jgi:hypothetical protein
MSRETSLSQADFEQLVAENHELFRRANDLEFQLYQMGDSPGPEQVQGCRRAAGNLIGLLRTVLFRHDQQVLPLLDPGGSADSDTQETS